MEEDNHSSSTAQPQSPQSSGASAKTIGSGIGKALPSFAFPEVIAPVSDKSTRKEERPIVARSETIASTDSGVRLSVVGDIDEVIHKKSEKQSHSSKTVAESSSYRRSSVTSPVTSPARASVSSSSEIQSTYFNRNTETNHSDNNQKTASIGAPQGVVSPATSDMSGGVKLGSQGSQGQPFELPEDALQKIAAARRLANERAKNKGKEPQTAIPVPQRNLSLTSQKASPTAQRHQQQPAEIPISPASAFRLEQRNSSNPGGRLHNESHFSAASPAPRKISIDAVASPTDRANKVEQHQDFSRRTQANNGRGEPIGQLSEGSDEDSDRSLLEEQGAPFHVTYRREPSPPNQQQFPPTAGAVSRVAQFNTIERLRSASAWEGVSPAAELYPSPDLPLPIKSKRPEQNQWCVWRRRKSN